jgi:HAD superfamily hydrolase (TIGR01509 family)
MMQKATPPKAVLFDCDGVVMARHGISFGAITDRLAKRGTHLNRGQMRELLRGGTQDSFVKHLQKHDDTIPEDWIRAEFDRIVVRLKQGAKLVPGILNVLDYLDDANIAYALGSNGPVIKLDVMLDQHPGLAERFRGHIYSGHTIRAPKPAPDLLFLVAAELGVDPEDCAIIDDGILGVRAAIAAGMPSYCYAAYDDAASLSAQAAELAEYDVTVFHHMRELPAILGLHALAGVA